MHNNLSESLIREDVQRRKISGGTRSEAGRQSRVIFASLKKLTDRLNGTDLFPRLSGIIENDSFFPPLLPAKGYCVRLCQCLVLVIGTSSLRLSAGILELPLFLSYTSPDNLLSPLRSHWVAFAGDPMESFTRFSGDLPGSVQHSGSDRAGTSLCITPDLSQEIDFPDCLPLPESSERVLVHIDGGHSDQHQAVMLLPVNKMLPPTISETHEKASVLPLPCEPSPCITWDYGGRISVFDLSETLFSAELVAGETKTRTTWEVVQAVDQNGNIIYQWYDQNGHLHTLSEWAFKRRLSMYFQSLLEFLYPEYFGPSIPAGGGWHPWQYWKVRRAADRPENTGQYRWSARQTQHQPNGRRGRPVAVVQPEQARFSTYQPRHQSRRPQPSPPGRALGRTVENDIDTLLMEFESGEMQESAARYNKNYDGRKHRQYCVKIKNATQTRKKPLTDDEKLRFVPFMNHLSGVVYSFNGRSLSTCIHSLVASQLFYPPRSIKGQRTVLDDGDRRVVKVAQVALIGNFITAIKSRARLPKGAPYGFDAQAISNLLWALVKLVENGLLPLDQGGLASQTVTALLPQVVTPPRSFNPQDISNLLWALAKLVENGLLPLDQGGLASQAVTALLPQVRSHQDNFTSQGVSNLLWALVKLVENGLLPLDQGGLASQTVTALLPQVVTPPGSFKPQEISNLLWALAKLVENGLLPLDQGGLASQAVTALLPQVRSHQDSFTSQGVSNLLWALAKLVENRLLPLDQGDLASQAVTALLPQVVTPPGSFNPQEISNLLWALVKLVENGLLPLDQGGLASQAVTALLPQVRNQQDNYPSQGVSNLLWALAKLVENGLLPLDQVGLASQTVTALLLQVRSHQYKFTSQGVSNLLWALVKLVENGLPQLHQGGLASQAVTALLPQVVTPPGSFKPQEISNLLWALAKLVENRLLPLDQGGLASQAVTALLPQVVTPPGLFNPQNISNLLWVLAKLVENRLLPLDQGGLASQAVTALLPQVVTPPGSFKPQEISNLLWALVKLVENGLLQLHQGGLASQAVTALLPQVVTPPGSFNPQDISNLLWALAKLVENGLLPLDQGGLASQAVTALLPQVVTPPGSFNPQNISNLLWALAALGDGVSLNEVLNILRTIDINTIELWRDQEITLWALTVFLARSGETNLLRPPMKRLYDALMAEKGNSSDIRVSIMCLSGTWLEENPQDFPLLNYKTIVSYPHRKLHEILSERFPRHALKMEASVNGLPPVDLLFPREKVVVEVQGAHHYIDKEKKLRNGSTILKTSTYRKLGYKVFEIPASDVTNIEKQKQWLRELRAYFSNEGNSADRSTESDYEKAEEDDWYSAAEEP